MSASELAVAGPFVGRWPRSAVSEGERRATTHHIGERVCPLIGVDKVWKVVEGRNSGRLHLLSWRPGYGNVPCSALCTSACCVVYPPCSPRCLHHAHTRCCCCCVLWGGQKKKKCVTRNFLCSFDVHRPCHEKHKRSTKLIVRSNGKHKDFFVKYAIFKDTTRGCVD